MIFITLKLGDEYEAYFVSTTKEFGNLNAHLPWRKRIISLTNKNLFSSTYNPKG